MDKPTMIHTGAQFSDDRKKRFSLYRFWDMDKPRIMFIGLNPSTANEQTDDPTIGRVIDFANSWGFGGVFMLNLFAQVTPYPKELTDFGNQDENDVYLRAHAKECSEIVFAWGGFPVAKGRAAEVFAMFPNAKCLKINADGSPKHPLYVLGTTVLVPFCKKK